jgi:hypothetical protein
VNGDLPSERDLDPRDVWPFQQVRRETAEFESILARHGITIRAGSPLEGMCLSLLDVEQRSRGDTMEDLRVAYRPAFGLYDLVRRVVRLRDHPEFTVLLDHLRLLNTGTIAQNIFAATDQVAAKIFELLIGLICLEVGAQTALDHPLTSYGDNPDILTTIEGRRWGFACKVLSGRSPITVFDRIEEGIHQIQVSPAEIGAVIINLKNVIDHDQMWPLLNAADYAAGRDTPTYASWPSYDGPLALLRQTALTCQRQLISTNGRENVRSLFTGRKSIPGVILFLQTTTSVQLAEGPANTVLGLFYLMHEGVRREDSVVLDKLNDAMHHH